MPDKACVTLFGPAESVYAVGSSHTTGNAIPFNTSYSRLVLVSTELYSLRRPMLPGAQGLICADYFPVQPEE